MVVKEPRRGKKRKRKEVFVIKENRAEPTVGHRERRGGEPKQE
jgi:hypothetical protein